MTANSTSPKTQMKQAKNDTGLLVPLLSEVESSENQITNGASISGAVLNISTTMIGAGIMSLPATIKVLGIIPGFIVLLGVAFFVEITVEFMLRFTQSGQANTYAGLVGESFGTLGSIGVQICVIITNLGCLIIYLIIIGKFPCLWFYNFLFCRLNLQVPQISTNTHFSIMESQFQIFASSGVLGLSMILFKGCQILCWL